MQKQQQRTKKMVIGAVMIGVYIALSYLAIPMGKFKITFEHFPVVICATLFGPMHAMLVGGIGEFLNQMFTFGFTPTTILWVIPIVVRGGVIGLAKKIFKSSMSVQRICDSKIPVLFGTVCIISGLLSSCVNTFALYVDSKMIGYYSYALVFGALTVRLVLSAVTSVVMTIMAKAIFHALKKGNLI